MTTDDAKQAMLANREKRPRYHVGERVKREPKRRQVEQVFMFVWRLARGEETPHKIGEER